MTKWKRTAIFTLLCSGLFLTGSTVMAQAATFEVVTETNQQQKIEQIIAVADVYGDGEKVSAAILKYPEPINPRTVTAKSFYVEGNTIEAVYTNDRPELTDKSVAGNYVILKFAYTNTAFDGELSQKRNDQAPQFNKSNNESAKDSNDMGTSTSPDIGEDVEVFANLDEKAISKAKRTDAPMISNRQLPNLTIKVKQIGSIISMNNTLYMPSSKVYEATAQPAQIITNFQQLTYTDTETGNSMPYNLYLPKNYDANKKYPLVVFIADASANINEVTTPLFQGNGATVFATPTEQMKHECIILAPQYTADLVDKLGMMTTDENVWTPGLTLVTKLIFDVINNYSVDNNRIYGTGQSQGGMANIAISDKYPELFAAQYLVACQWNIDEMEILKNKNLWITVCEGDTKAFPEMNKAVDRWRVLNAKIARNKKFWDSKSSISDINKKVNDMIKQNANINYTVFKDGNHMYTWSFAYNIDSIRDWLFSKSK